MRCPRCGFNNRNEQQACLRCGFQLQLAQSAQDSATDLPVSIPLNPDDDNHITREQLEVRPSPPRTRRSLWEALFPRLEQIAGTVIAVEPVHEERRNRNWSRIISGCLVTVLLLALPLILLRYLAIHSLLIAVVIVLLFIILIKFFSFGRILKGLFFLRLLWPRQQDDRVPVRYLRLRNGYQGEYIVRIRGRLDGHLMPGDEVSLQGNFRDGIFEMKSGTNLRTGSSFSVHRQR